MNEMTTAGPAWADAATPGVTKIPPPTTLAMPIAVRLNGPTAFESSRARSRLACRMIVSSAPRRGRDPSIGEKPNRDGSHDHAVDVALALAAAFLFALGNTFQQKAGLDEPTEGASSSL